MEVTNPTKRTPELVQKLEEAAMMGCSNSEMALFADISPSTLYNWFESDPDFKERLERLKETPILKARGTITKNLHKEETAKWFLERKKKVEFSPHSTSDITSGGKPIVIPSDLHGKHRDPDASAE